MALTILDYAASVPANTTFSASIIIPTAPNRLQLASIGIFIPTTAGGANRVELTTSVGLLRNIFGSSGTVLFRILRDGNEIFNGLQTTSSGAPPGFASVVPTFETIDFDVPAGFHVYSVTVESILFDNSVIGPITFSGTAIGTEQSVNNNQVLTYQASVPRSVALVGDPIILPISPARTQLAGLGVFIPTSGSRSNRVQLKATIGVEGTTAQERDYILRIFRDGGEIYNTQASMTTETLTLNLTTIQTIDLDVAAGFHIYTITAESVEGDVRVNGPITFSGWVIGTDTAPSTPLQNQVLDYAASLPRSIVVADDPLTIPRTPARLEVAGVGIFIPHAYVGNNRVQLIGTIGLFMPPGSNDVLLRIRIFRDGSEIFNAAYVLAVLFQRYGVVSVQTIDFNLTKKFHTYSMTIEITTGVTPEDTCQVIGPISLSATALGLIE
ncbi:hypothetical protein [Marininema halotolerans]|uniref:Uncharacterized protein n=1 Tax=Marininema halotolerans TaxID=1155944 RepID=A0A1I6R498_9BACL|nr:hypothetical protein [Marininema halotolerans]SFS59496.1 hypothetical protein SAMN05444972_104106 [Marininema halotolerans]